MEFLKDIALSASSEHYHLLVFIAAMCAIIFVLYLSFVLGSSIISYRLEKKGRKEKNSVLLKSAFDLINSALYSKSVVLFFGILPGFSLVAAYAQLFKSSSSISVDFIGFGFVFIFMALVLLYSYKYTFRLQNFLESYQSLARNQGNTELDDETFFAYGDVNKLGHLRMGKYGIACLAFGMFLYSAALSIAGDPAQWQPIQSIFDILLTVGVWIKFLTVLVLSAGLTGFGTVALNFLRNSLTAADAHDPLKKINIRLSVFSLFLVPLLILANIENIPEMAISENGFLLFGIALTLFFLAANFLYGFHRTGRWQAMIYGFLFFLLASGIIISSDYTGIEMATRVQSESLSLENQKGLDALKASLGVATVRFTGEDIYNNRCAACHLFDQKKVGPPYYETIPKYKNDKAALVSFILNPVKKNPDYSPMPNQGLRPAEADSIAGYVLRMVAQHSLR